MKNHLLNTKTHHKKFCCVFVIILSIFLIVLTVSTVVGIVNKVREGRHTISVTDKGEIYLKPDLAIIDFSVVSEAKTVDRAMAENVEKMNNVIFSVKQEGLDEKDLKSTYFNLSPLYEYQKEEIEIYLYSPGKRVLVGYEVTQTLQVKIRDLNKIGTIIEKATGSGANQVSSLQLTIDKQEELKEQVRAEAIEKTKAKAERLASRLGLKLVRITNFNESGEVPYFYGPSEVKGLGGEAAPAIPEIQAGENKITVTVTITYEIR